VTPVLLPQTRGSDFQHLHVWLVHNEGLGTWLTGLATMGLAIGVVFAWSALRDARKTRHAQLLAVFSERFDDDSMNESAKLGRAFGPASLVQLSEKLYGSDAQHPPDPADVEAWKANIDDWFSVTKWPNLLETIGVMVHAGALPRALIYRMWGGPIIDAWRRDWEKAVVAHRGHMDDANIYRYFEWLAEQMEKEREIDVRARSATTSVAESEERAAESAGIP
jgi:hypothetical protein